MKKLSSQLLDRDYILTNVNDNDLCVEIFETIDSTSEYLRKLPLASSPRVCLAEQQTQARGRRGNSWHSPFAENIYMSCRYTLQKDISEISGLSLVVALAVIKALKKFCPEAVIMAKWPNDLMCQAEKLAGILVDIQTTTQDVTTVIIGIGLNVNMKADYELQISQAWTSIRKILGVDIDRNAICVEIVNKLLSYLECFTAKGFAGFIAEWSDADYLVGQEISINIGDETFAGVAHGVDKLGNLLLLLPDGATKICSAGETVRCSK